MHQRLKQNTDKCAACCLKCSRQQPREILIMIHWNDSECLLQFLLQFINHRKKICVHLAALCQTLLITYRCRRSRWCGGQLVHDIQPGPVFDPTACHITSPSAGVNTSVPRGESPDGAAGKSLTLAALWWIPPRWVFTVLGSHLKLKEVHIEQSDVEVVEHKVCVFMCVCVWGVEL